MSIDFNPNKPVGSTKDVIRLVPIMEQFNKYHKQGLKCSIEPNSSDTSSGAKQFFNKYGYMIIENLCDPKEIYHPVPKERGQYSYWGKKLHQFNYIPEERQVNGSLSRYSHPYYRELHNKIRIILEDILEEKLYNTYYYDRFYFVGQRLFRHADRDACEVSVSIQVSTNSDVPWPFCIETPSGEEHFAILQDGWGLLYKGCEREHWRDPLQSRYTKFGKFINKITKKEDDTYHHQIFFHYVRANGPRAHCAYDMAK
jgi:hypothetical protein